MFGIQVDPGYNSPIQLIISPSKAASLRGVNNLTDDFIYSDIYDCLSRAKWYIENYKSILENFFHSLSR